MKHSKNPICGIYKITNRINGKAYIGKSTDIKYRWLQHLNNTNKSKFQYALACALRKYGKDNFDWEIVECCSESELDDKEIFYIAKFNTFNGDHCGWGYNMTRGGDGQSGTGVQVYQYSLEGEYIRCFNSIEEASNKTKACASGITNCCTHRRKSCGGFIWSYTKEEKVPPYRHNSKVPVAQYTKDGEFVRIFETVTKAADSVGRTKTQVSMCCRGKTPSCGGYVWRYVA